MTIEWNLDFNITANSWSNSVKVLAETNCILKVKHVEIKKRPYLLLPRSLPRHRRLSVDPTKRKVKIVFFCTKSLHIETHKEVEDVFYRLKIRTAINPPLEVSYYKSKY